MGYELLVSGRVYNFVFFCTTEQGPATASIPYGSVWEERKKEQRLQALDKEVPRKISRRLRLNSKKNRKCDFGRFFGLVKGKLQGVFFFAGWRVDPTYCWWFRNPAPPGM